MPRTTLIRRSPCGRRLLSCSADRQLIIRDVVDPSDCTTRVRHSLKLPGLSSSAPPSLLLRAAAHVPSQAPAGGALDMEVGMGAGGRAVAVVAMAGGLLRVVDLEAGTQLGVCEVAWPGFNGAHTLLPHQSIPAP